MKKKELIIKDCSNIFALFDGGDGSLIDEIGDLTHSCNDPVSNFLWKQKSKKLAKNCSNCWFRLSSVAFTYGFVAAMKLKPGSKIALKAIQNIAKSIEKAMDLN